MPTVLIIDDDSSIRASLTLLLKRAGYEVLKAEGPDQALAILRQSKPDVILMDMNFSLSTKGEEGLELLQRTKIFAPDTPVILLTAWGSIELAVRGMKAGAFDFISKPWDNRQLLMTIENAISITAESTAEVNPDFPNIIGQSTAMQELLQTVARIAPTTASVLITGESGTGKELIAEAIHRLSKRNSEPFVKVNLGGIPQNLFESEMFGHKKGAFTDAYTDRKGRFLLADKGTIFLDEIGDLDASCQVKLLRVLQDQSFEVLGESQPRRVDVRVVSATNADLRQKVQEGTFREDLFFRINLIHLHLPALRERPDDIPLLVNHFVKQSGRDVQFTDEAISRLQSLPFSGNIRELKNLVERTILMSNSDTITPQLLTPFLLPDKTNPRPQPEVTDHRTLEEMECDEIKRQLVIHRGNMSKVAKALGISRAALYRRIDKYGL